VWQRGSDLQLVDRLRRDVSGESVMGSPRVVVVLAWVYVLLLPLAGAAELAGLIDQAIGRERRWCLPATLSGRAGRQGRQASKQKKLFLRGFPLHQLQRHFFCFASRPLVTALSPSFLHFNCTIPLAFCSLLQPQHSAAPEPFRSPTVSAIVNMSEITHPTIKGT